MFVRGDLWIALLVQAWSRESLGLVPPSGQPLRAFDVQYLAELRPPAEVIGNLERCEARLCTGRLITEKSIFHLRA